MKVFAAASLLACVSTVSMGQIVTIDPTNKYAWAENVGFINMGDANGGADAVQDFGTYLGGFAWGENIGWINFGDGSPTNGVNYANANNTDFGVNIDIITGNLSGFAWAENVGWINFSGGALATPAKPARIDFASLRFRGYAWGENIGWINFDDPNIFVGVVTCPCVADFDASGGTPDAGDIDAFFVSWLAGEPSADADCSGGTPDASDIDQFFQEWLAGGC